MTDSIAGHSQTPTKTKTWKIIFWILGISIFLITIFAVYIYTHKKGCVIENIMVSNTLQEEGINAETIRIILKQQIEEYLAQLDIMPQKRFALTNETFSAKKEKENLTIHTKFVSFAYQDIIEWIGDGLGGNSQTSMNISITSDALGYQCYLNIEDKPVWTTKALKADYLEPEYAFKAVMLQLSIRILEQSDPELVAQYYFDTQQRSEGLRLAGDLMSNKDYMRDKRFTNLVHNLYNNLGFFHLIHQDVESFSNNHPKNVTPYRLLLFDAIQKDSSAAVIHKRMLALKSRDPNDPYLLTHSGMYYLKVKQYDSALHYYSAAAKNTNKQNYSTDHNLYILRSAAQSAYALNTYALADSFFKEHTVYSPFGMDAGYFYDSSYRYLFKDAGENSALGKFIRALWTENSLQVLNLLLAADSVAKNNLLIKLLIANAYAREGNFRECDSIYTHVMIQEPSNHIVFTELAETYELRKEYMNMFLAAKRALAFQRYSSKAYGTLIFAALNLERPEQAADFCYEVLNYDPENWFAHEKLGDLFYRRQMANKSIMHYQRSLRVTGLNPDIVIRIKKKIIFTNKFLNSQGNDDPETRQLKQLMNSLMSSYSQFSHIANREMKDSDPHYINSMKELNSAEVAASESFNKGKNEEALGHSKQALAISSLSVQGNLIQGLSRIKLGQAESAKKNLTIALKEIEKWRNINAIIEQLDNTLKVLEFIQQQLARDEQEPSLDQIIELYKNTLQKYVNERVK